MTRVFIEGLSSRVYLYLQSGQQPDADSFVAAFAALAPTVTASATSASTFGLMVSGFIMISLVCPRNHSEHIVRVRLQVGLKVKTPPWA